MVDTVETAVYKLGYQTSDSVQALNASRDAALQNVEAAEQLSQSEEKVTRATRTSTEAMERLLAKLDPRIRAERDLQRTIDQANRLAQEGIGTEQQRTQVLDLATRKYLDQVTALERAAAGQKQLTAAIAETTAMQERANSAPAINARLGVAGDFNSAQRAEDVAVYGRSLDTLRARYSPIFAASEQYRTEQEQINAALKVGAISVAEYESALTALDVKYKNVAAAAERLAAAQARAAALAVNSSGAIDARLGVTNDFNTASRGADVAAYGRSLDDLRAKYNPLYAVQRQFEEEQLAINNALSVGALTQQEHSAALSRARVAYRDHAEAVTSAKVAQQGFLQSIGLSAGAVAAMEALLVAFKAGEFIKKTFEQTAAIELQAKQLGFTTDALQAFHAAAVLSGAGAEAGDNAIRRFTRSIGDAQGVMGPARKAYIDLFGDAKTAAEALAGGPESALPKVAARILMIKDATERARIEVTLMGRAGQESEAFLEKWADPNIVKNMKDIGLVLDESIVKEAHDAEVAWNGFWLRFGTQAAANAGAIIKAFAEVKDYLANLTIPDDSFVGWLNQLQGGLTQAQDKQLQDFMRKNPGKPLSSAFDQGAVHEVPSQFHLTSAPGVDAQAAADAEAFFKGLNKNFDEYLAKQRLATELAKETSEQRKIDAALIDAANAKLKDTGRENDTVLTSMKQVRDILKDQGVQLVANAAHAEALGEAYAKAFEAAGIKTAITPITDIMQAHLKPATPIQTAFQDTGSPLYAKGAEEAAHWNDKTLEALMGGSKELIKQATSMAEIKTLAQKDWDLTVGKDITYQKIIEALETQVRLADMLPEARARELAIEQAHLALKRELTAAEKTQIGDLVSAAGEDRFGAKGAEEYLQLLERVDQHTQIAAQGMADAFGKVGKAVGALSTTMSSYDVQRQAISAREIQERTRGISAEKAASDASKDRAALDVQYTGDMLDAAKGFFSEKTAIYKGLQAAEEVYRAIQLASAIQNIASAATETTATVAAAGTQASAWGVVAFAHALASLPFPWDLAAGAAVIAALLAVGVAIGGGGGGGATPGATDAVDRQKLAGTGSVLGDSAAQSASITRAIEIAAKNSNTMLEYSNSMVNYLRDISTNIGSLTNAIARQIGVGGGAFSTAGLGLGSTHQSAGLPLELLLGGPISTNTTKTLQDFGIDFKTQALVDGIKADIYQQVLKSSSTNFLGIKVSSSSSVDTAHSPLTADLADQIGKVVDSLRTGVLSAAGTLGVSGAEAVLNSFQVSLGKISFQGLTGAQIQDELNSVFGKLADDLAIAALPVIRTFQKVGEGAFETLVRLARDYQVVDVTLQSIGKTFATVGTSSIAARERLVNLAGGLDEFTNQAKFFADNFLTETQRLAPIISAVNKEMARLGESGIKTKEQFANLVMGLDVSTESGAAMYSALMAVAPAFAKVADSAVEAAQKATDAINSLQSLINSIKFGSSSAEPPDKQYFEVLSQYNAAKQAALGTGGDTQIAAFQTAAQNLLPIARSFLGTSERYGALAADVVSSATQLQVGLSTGIQSGIDFHPVVEATVAGSTAIVSAVQDVAAGIDSLNTKFTALSGQVESLARRVA